MNWLDAIILGIVEGITEFLPVSSTGHLIIASSVLGLAQDPFTKAFEVIIQMGAILTVLALYWRRFLPQWGFYRKILLAFLPTAVIGFLLKDFVDQWMESPWIVAWALVVGGIVLLFVDRWWPNEGGTGTDELADATCVKLGVIQCLALVPGVSRSGATIVGGMALGMSRAQAAEFSFFLAVPTMAAATGYKLLKMLTGGASFTGEQWGLLGIGFFVSFVVAGLAIKSFVGFLQKRGFRLFGWYRIVVGAILLALLASGRDLSL